MLVQVDTKTFVQKFGINKMSAPKCHCLKQLISYQHSLSVPVDI